LQAEQPIQRLQGVLRKLEGDVRMKREQVRRAQGSEDSLAAENAQLVKNKRRMDGLQVLLKRRTVRISESFPLDSLLACLRQERNL
jgi:hypothetical protein